MRSFTLMTVLSLGLVMALSAGLGCKQKELNNIEKPPSSEPAKQAKAPATPEEEKKADEPEPAKAAPEGDEAKAAEETKEEGKAEEGDKKEAGEKKTIPDDKAKLVLKQAKGKMPPVKFPHKEHAERLEGDCSACHHDEIEACSKCHGMKKGADGEPTFKTVAHKTCQGCHKKQKKGPKACTKCHK